MVEFFYAFTFHFYIMGALMVGLPMAYPCFTYDSGVKTYELKFGQICKSKRVGNELIYFFI